MNVIIHDLPGRDRLEELLGPMNDDDKIIERKDKDPVPCMGCFGCWIKTPGMCVIKDGFEDTGAYMGAAQELRIVSRCTYGEFSPFVKKVLDRSISYCHPYFVKRNGETHHKMRYTNTLKIRVLAYGDNLTDDEKECMRSRAIAMGRNLGTNDVEINFITESMEN